MDREYSVRATRVAVRESMLEVALEDGRSLSVPLWWYPRLEAATAEQRSRWELSPGGFGIHWAEIDEDIGIWALLTGGPAPGAVPPHEPAVAG